MDSTCTKRLQETPADVLPFIGGAGSPPALFTTERRLVAPTFYPCAYSFTKYLISRTSAPYLASLFPQIGQGTAMDSLEARLGQTMTQLREAWLVGVRNADARGQ